MQALFMLGIVILGFLVLFGVIRPSKAFGYIFGFCAFIIFAPILLGAIRQQASGLAWWQYVVGFFALLLVFRVFLDSLFRRGR